MRIADRELDAEQTARDESSEEVGLERLGLGLADVDREDLAPPGLMHTVGDDQRLVDDAPRRRGPFSTLASKNT